MSDSVTMTPSRTGECSGCHKERAVTGLLGNRFSLCADCLRSMAECLDQFEWGPAFVKGSRGRLCFDFDGTIAIYKGWDVHGKTPGEPVPGALEFVWRKIAEGYTCFVATARDDLDAVRGWLAQHGFPPMLVMSKPTALAYIDDRAVRFLGSWEDYAVDVEADCWWKERA